jgi:acetyl esterase/lipase
MALVLLGASCAAKPAAADPDRDVLYVANGARGCVGRPSHEPCGGSHTLDVYRAKGPAKGTIVFVHGGGFAGGDKSQKVEFAPFLRQTERGWDVVAVNYRLLDRNRPDTLFPAAVRDVAAAIGWLKAIGPTMGLATGRIVTAGHSAGATIAALIGTGWNSGDATLGTLPRVDGYVSVAGAHLFIAGPSSQRWGDLWVTGSAGSLLSASPLTWLDPADPPGYLVHDPADTSVEVTGTELMALGAAAMGHPEKVHVELVDMARIGAAPLAHLPTAAADPKRLDAFLDSV